jgi:O-antigen/teichoic acid export membrane protein
MMLRNLLWDMGGKLGSQIASLAISMLLTRILDPDEFGVMGIAMVFITASSAFLDMGFSRALIQEKQVSLDQYSSVFFLNLAVGLLLGFLCFALAIPISGFYRHEGLEHILQVLSVLFIANSVSLVPGAILARQMNFRAISLTALVSSVLSGVAGVYMAFKGYGVWSLVVQQIMASVIKTVLYFGISKWIPAFTIDWKLIRSLWVYSSHLFTASIIGNIGSRLDVFLIGKWYSTSILGFYSRSQSFESQFRVITSGSLTSVFFSFIARLKDQKELLLETYTRYLHISAFLSTWIAGLLYLITPDIFDLLFTAKWSVAASYFQLMIIAGVGWPISAIMVTLIAAIGNSKTFLRLELIRFFVLLPVFFLGIRSGIVPFLVIMVAVRMAFLLLNIYYVHKELSVSILLQVRIIGTYLGTALLAYLIAAGMMFWMQVKFPVFRIFLMALFFTLASFLLQKLWQTQALTELAAIWAKGKAYLRKIR